MMKFRSRGILSATALVCATGLLAAGAQAQTLNSNATGTHDGYYYTFWKDSGSASMTLMPGGRYTSQWTSNTNNWVGGKGWNPGGARVVNYSGNYGVNNSQNSYLALYGWTRNPLIEYYIVESYGSYNPASCSGGVDYGSFQSDGATYNVRRCQRVNAPSIDGTQTFYQYFSVRNPKKGFGNISGTINVGNHFNYWASRGLNLGNHFYMVMASEGYQSQGSTDITVSSGSGGGGTNPPPAGSKTIVVRARGTAGGESISLKVNNATVATWTLTTSMANYTATTPASGGSVVEFTNDGGNRDVQVDYISVNGSIRQSEDQTYNTGVYQNGQCGGGNGRSEWLHCNGAIGYGNL
ncbi:glycoside hydrolase family 11 protein [Luteimonas marina]|nr:glycoside hydrolase family 11 protein [Luteimonas marina]